MGTDSIYNVYELNGYLAIDGDWYKDRWRNIEAIDLKNFMGDIPYFCPSVKVKMMYNGENIYAIFRVEDCYVGCKEQNYNGPVSNDACVEFFFSPDINLPERYFNIEVNCGGTPLMKYNVIPRKEYKTLEINDIKEVEIAHSLPSKVDPEISEPITWTIEYRIPFTLLQKFSNVAIPQKGVYWRANFYKIAVKTSNPHWITWSFIDTAKPDFHLPQYFGVLKFM
ncbi:MAG: hypothetical protein JWP81_2555 [Ferruginibacter sp.]|nr:hypothetical protein [Ferruginibacter sp.]